MNLHLVALFIVANCFDLLTTHINGLESEANPIVAAIWRKGGFIAYVAFKLASVAWGVFTYNRLLSQDWRISSIRMDIVTHATFWLLTLIQTGVVGWNCFGYFYNLQLQRG